MLEKQPVEHINGSPELDKILEQRDKRRSHAIENRMGQFSLRKIHGKK
jgi:hypothetical protein